jgi:hypothetical protein
MDAWYRMTIKIHGDGRTIQFSSEIDDFNRLLERLNEEIARRQIAVSSVLDWTVLPASSLAYLRPAALAPEGLAQKLGRYIHGTMFNLLMFLFPILFLQFRGEGLLSNISVATYPSMLVVGAYMNGVRTRAWLSGVGFRSGLTPRRLFWLVVGFYFLLSLAMNAFALRDFLSASAVHNFVIAYVLILLFSLYVAVSFLLLWWSALNETERGSAHQDSGAPLVAASFR